MVKTVNKDLPVRDTLRTTCSVNPKKTECYRYSKFHRRRP